VRRPRLLTAEQRDQLSELAQQRGAVKQQQVKKKELIEAAADEEMKISAAIAGRSVVAQQGVKDLQLFVANISRIEAGSAKSMSAISGIQGSTPYADVC
jgi:tRNA(Ile)-lysidine synthase TilS/MesJ